jgi:putative transcriptional regulator
MDEINDEFFLVKNKLAKDIVGEIVMSDSPEKAIKKWRSIFKISQKRLSRELGITPSVVSDYESGRRKSPGIRMIKKYVDALLKIDEDRGAMTTRSFSRQKDESLPISNAIMDIKEFSSGMSAQEFCRKINAVPYVKSNMENDIYGYTIIDSPKAITELSFSELIKLYGLTTQRALVFTKTKTGKTPMVAIKLTSLRPGLVVLHGLDVVDDVAKRIAEAEGIPLAVCRMDKIEDIIESAKTVK